MKGTITNKFFTAFILCAVALVSCNKDDDDDTPDVDAAGCKLTTIVETEFGDLDEKDVTEVEYNSQGYVIKVTEKEFYKNNLEDTDVITFEYNSNNQLIKETEDDGDYITFEYNSNGTVSKSSYYDSGVLEGFYTYTYDSNKRITEAIDHYNGITDRVTIEYVGNTENISKINHFDSSDNQLDLVTIYEDYDDKLNPEYAQKGKVLIADSKNNPRKITWVYKSNNPGQPDDTEEFTYTYKYNNSGFVTEKVQFEDNGTEEGDKLVYTYSGCN